MFKNIHSSKDLENYLHQNIEETPVQKEMREFSFKEFGDIANMQISAQQASFLNFLIKIGNYKKILELGTFMGYSTLAMALALDKEGRIFTVDKDIKTTSYAKKFWKKAEVTNQIIMINSDAITALQNFIKQKLIFDFIFIDADKSGYKTYFDNCLDLISENGLIIFDNVLWKGKVADLSLNDKKTETIREFNKYIKNDNRVDTTMISIGDGMTLCKKKKNSIL